MSLDQTLLQRLVCPEHGGGFVCDGSRLKCKEGHEYPIVDDVPVLLVDRPYTLWVAENSFKYARDEDARARDPYAINTVGILPERRAQLARELSGPASEVDPVVRYLIVATNGNAYTHLVGSLQEYPIPEIRVPQGNGEILLDVGCSWGRWCVAAGRAGYTPIGIDPSLGAVLAARRVAARLGIRAHFVVGDARFLPFAPRSIDIVHSYSVIQHFSRDDADLALKEIGRVVKANGRTVIQMPTAFGIRCLYQQARRGFRKTRDFNVRYWTVPALRRLLSRYVGPTSFSVDCFFGIGLQAADLRLMPPTYRAVIGASEKLRKASERYHWITYLADSVYAESTKLG